MKKKYLQVVFWTDAKSIEKINTNGSQYVMLDSLIFLTEVII